MTATLAVESLTGATRGIGRAMMEPTIAWWNMVGLHTYSHPDRPESCCLRHPVTGEWWVSWSGVPTVARCCDEHPRHAAPYDAAADRFAVALLRWAAQIHGDLFQPRHRACPLHPHPDEPGVWSAPGYYACVPDCWTGSDRCPSFDTHRPGYDVYCGENRWCEVCDETRPACGEDHCLDCGAAT